MGDTSGRRSRAIRADKWDDGEALIARPGKEEVAWLPNNAL